MKDSKIVTWLGLIVAIAGVFASPEFAAVVGDQFAAVATLAGTLLAAIGKALGATDD